MRWPGAALFPGWRARPGRGGDGRVPYHPPMTSHHPPPPRDPAVPTKRSLVKPLVGGPTFCFGVLWLLFMRGTHHGLSFALAMIVCSVALFHAPSGSSRMFQIGFLCGLVLLAAFLYGAAIWVNGLAGILN